MKKILLTLLVLPSLALAQSVSLRIDLPVVLALLVVNAPGVRVVPEVNEEVFLVDGWYWCHRDGGWVQAPVRAVPARLVEIPEGRYCRWMPPGQAKKMERRERGDGPGRGHGRDHDD